MQRWPAVPTAAKRMARTARSRSADGATIMALFPPSSSNERPRRAVTRGPHLLAHGRAAGGADEPQAPIVDQPLADVAAADDDLAETVGRVAELLHRPGEEGLAREGRDRRLFRGLPHDGIATDDGEGEVPRPNGNRKIEGADDADSAERVPRLHHPVAGALGSDREPIELARHSDGEVADIDHLLDLAEPLLQDLAVLHRDETAERFLVGAQFLVEEPDEFTAARRRHGTPFGKGGVGLGHLAVEVARRIHAQPRDLAAIDG